MNVRTTDFLYRLAYRGPLSQVFSWHEPYSMTFCTYARHIIRAAVAYVVALMVLTGAPYVIFSVFVHGFGSDPATWYVAKLFNHNIILDIFLLIWMFIGIISTMVVLAIGFAFTVACIVQSLGWLGSRAISRRPDHEPSFVQTAYAAYKEKFCPIINVVDKNEQ